MQGCWKQLYGYLLPISQAIQIRWAENAGHCWWSKDELIGDVPQWTTIDGHTSVGWPTKTYIYQFWVDTGCCLEKLPRVMADRDGWQERVKGICANKVPC